MTNIITTPDEETLLKLLQLLPEWRQRLISRGTLTQISDEGVPGLLIVKVPSGGLAAYSGTGMVPSCEGQVQQPKWVVPFTSPEIEGVSGITGAFTQTVYNVLPTAFAAGDKIIAGRLSNGGYFALGSASSGSTSTDAGCGCECIDTPDITVNGIQTTSRWTVTVNKAKKWRSTYGWIELPPGEYIIVWNGTKWYLDIGDSLEAYLTNGTNVTSTTVMDGYIEMVWPSGTAAPYVQFCVEGSVGETASGAGFGAGYGDGYWLGFAAGASGGSSNPSGAYPGSTSFSGSTGGSEDAAWSSGYSAGFFYGYMAGYADGLSSSGSGSSGGSSGGGGSLGSPGEGGP